MSYLLKTTNVPLITSKLTAFGRQKLASGQLNFKYFALGDSQIDYNADISQNILKPKDFQPNVKTFLTKSDCNPYNEIDGVKVLECCVHNLLDSKGFFQSGNIKYSNTSYIKTYGTVNSQQLNGGNTINLGTTNFNDGDIIFFKIVNPTIGFSPDIETIAVPHLFYKISKNPTSKIVELDRNLPYLDYSGLLISFYIIDKDFSTFSTTNQNTLWDYNKLKFKLNCLEEDTIVWNFNIVWNENLIGTQTNQQQFNQYCSYSYAGQKEYLGYNIDCPDVVNVTNCEDKLLGVDDDFVKAIGIIHYTNTNKDNALGEYFYIEDSNSIEISMPHIMWHRRNFSGFSGTGTDVGMLFNNDTTKKYVDNTNIEYYDLIENSSLVITPKSVGRIFPQLQIIVIHDEELLAALSYKSNRNFTFPKLTGKMISPSVSGNGVLPKGKTMYVSYTFEADNIIKNVLPHQQYLKFVNNTNSDKDIEFYMEQTGFLPYLKQREDIDYDGLGFSFHRFKVLVQIVDTNERPLSQNWKIIDYTNNFITNFAGYTINPLYLENQNPQATGFYINSTKFGTATDYNLNVLQIPDDTCPNKMGFGCENVFFGNVSVTIGACVYKSIIELSIDSDIFVKSTNPTWTSDDELILSEVAFLDSEYNLVWHNAFYEPINLPSNSISLIESQIDF